jgi:uncharacterized protein
VYRPMGPGPWPTLLTRHPYGKDVLEESAWCGLDPVQAARRGFIVAVQDTRGRFASEGEWDPFRFEAQDGYDSVEWAARLPGANGRVAMFGGSYHGNTQWLAAIERPPSLAAIAPMLTWSDPMDGLFARGGAIELGLAVVWPLITGLDYLRRFGASEDEVRRRVDAVIDDWDRLDVDGYWDLPVHDNAVLKRHGFPDLGSLRALADPSFAEQCRVAGSHDRVLVPSLHLAGWYDRFLQGTLDNYQAMAALGRETRLVVGPWTHETFTDPIGNQVFGLRAARDGVPAHADGDWNDLQLAWFRRHLVESSVVPAEAAEAPVRIFVMGRNEWRDESSWPPPRAVQERWFLHAGGSLGPASPELSDQATAFTYDPAKPVPTAGGAIRMWPGFAAGPLDQAEVEARDDVLVFTSQPLDRDLEVTGRVRVILCAESSAPSTDWVARLCDVHPDGRSFVLCDGIKRVEHGARRRELQEIDLWSTSNVFLRGHRLRVQVTSSSFPRWDRNLNTGNQRDRHHEIAHQRVYHDANHTSYIELPVISS